MMRSRRRTSRHEVGAAVVEYALVVAVVAAGLIGSIDSLEDKSGDELASRGNHIGMPSDGGSAALVTTTTSPPPSTTSTTSATTVSHVSNMVGQGTKVSNNKWIAKSTFTVVGPTGAVVANATVSGTWTVDGGSSSSTSCVTNGDGVCNVTRDKLDGNDESAVFVLTNISGSGLSWSPGADTPATVTISKPAGVT